jgi:hypothetical protein
MTVTIQDAMVASVYGPRLQNALPCISTKLGAWRRPRRDVALNRNQIERGSCLSAISGILLAVFIVASQGVAADEGGADDGLVFPTQLQGVIPQAIAQGASAERQRQTRSEINANLDQLAQQLARNSCISQVLVGGNPGIPQQGADTCS